MTGSSRISQEASERAAAALNQQEIERKQRERDRKREALEAHITALRKDFALEEDETERIVLEETTREEIVVQNRQSMAHSRGADTVKSAGRPRKGPRS